MNVSWVDLGSKAVHACAMWGHPGSQSWCMGDAPVLIVDVYMAVSWGHYRFYAYTSPVYSLQKCCLVFVSVRLGTRARCSCKGYTCLFKGKGSTCALLPGQRHKSAV